MADTETLPRFQIDVTVPRQARFVPTVRDLAVQAARYAGCSPPDADAFGHSVAAVVGDQLQRGTPDTPIAVVVRRDDGPLEVLIDEQTISLDL